MTYFEEMMEIENKREQANKKLCYLHLSGRAHTFVRERACARVRACDGKVVVDGGICMR